jgi:hypothetical protein
MKRLIVTMAGLAALLVSAPAGAQGVYFEFGSGDHPRYYDDSPPPRYYRYGPSYREDYRPRYTYRNVCWRVPYQHRSHHHYITRYRTVCE